MDRGVGLGACHCVGSIGEWVNEGEAFPGVVICWLEKKGSSHSKRAKLVLTCCVVTHSVGDRRFYMVDSKATGIKIPYVRKMVVKRLM